jgi:hypothetical protein
MEEEVRRNFAAACDTILPGSSAAGLHERVAGLFDAAIPGYSLLSSGLLDAFAVDVRPEASFADLTDEERSQVLRTMLADEGVDVRDVADGIILFTLGQNYSETHPERESIWRRIGYHGPSEGIADYA